MTVAENVVLGWSRGGGRTFSKKAVEKEVAAAAEASELHVDPSAYVWQLSVGERQRVEILKALYRGARTLILDEPTTVLTPQEVERLLASLRRLADEGTAVVFISHKLQEVLTACDRVTVLRAGRVTGTVELRDEHDGEVDARALARMMVGRDVELARRHERRGPPARTRVLELRDVEVLNDFGRPAVAGVSFEVHAGEILGIAGVAGNGQRELADGIYGTRPLAAGEVALRGELLPSGQPRARIERGLAYVPEERTGIGLAPGLDLVGNVVLKAFRSERFSAGPFVRRRPAVTATVDLLRAFDVKKPPGTLVRELSGGNAQRLLLGRELSSEPVALVVAAPTRGLDVAATESVRRLLLGAAESGVAVVMISEDLDEILALADRVAVMCAGRVTGIVEAAGADVDEIGLMMMGHSTAA
jgi:simple sugar transport system ATP-binding protein